MKEVLIINGSGGVGKGTFVRELQDLTKTWYISIADCAKRMARLAGWEINKKTERDRKFLYDLKHLVDEYNDYNYFEVANIVSAFKKDPTAEILCIDMREKEQIERAQKEFGAKTVLITRANVTPITSNPADKDVTNLKYDYIIDNDGSISELKQKASALLDALRKNYYAESYTVHPKNYSKIIYISHPYSGKRSNLDDIERIVLSLMKELPDYLFLSACHSFGYQYQEMSYEDGLAECLWLLDRADEMWVYGDWKNSRGCKAEVEYCKEKGVPFRIFNFKETEE